MAAESCTNLKTLYEETVIPLNAELKRQLVDAVIALLQVVIGGIFLLALLLLALKYFDPQETMVPRIHVVGLAALFICVLSGWVLYCRLKRRAQCFKETVIPVIAQLVDPGIKYKSEGMIMPLLYKDSCLYRDYDRYSGADLFYGTYRGIHFKFSHVVSEYYTETRSDSGSRSRSWHDIFRGIFFVVDFNKEFHSLTLVKPDRIEGTLGRGISSFFQKMDSSQPGKLIRMEDAAFEKAFVITSTDELEARYQLTPNLMERILKMKERFKPSSIALSFCNSKLYIGIPTRTAFFSYRGGDVTMDDLEWVYREIKTFVSIIDDLNLTLRIWSKE